MDIITQVRKINRKLHLKSFSILKCQNIISLPDFKSKQNMQSISESFVYIQFCMCFLVCLLSCFLNPVSEYFIIKTNTEQSILSHTVANKMPKIHLSSYYYCTCALPQYPFTSFNSSPSCHRKPFAHYHSSSTTSFNNFHNPEHCSRV